MLRKLDRILCFFELCRKSNVTTVGEGWLAVSYCKVCKDTWFPNQPPYDEGY